MSGERSTMEAAAIRELCKPLHLPTVATQALRMAEQAAKEKLNHLGYLEALLSSEVEERQQNAAARCTQGRRHVKRIGAGRIRRPRSPCRRSAGPQSEAKTRIPSFSFNSLAIRSWPGLRVC